MSLRPGSTVLDPVTENHDLGQSSAQDIELEITVRDTNKSPTFDVSNENKFGKAEVLKDAKDVLTHVIHVDDDPSLSPWTVRAFFLGGLVPEHTSTLLTKIL